MFLIVVQRISAAVLDVLLPVLNEMKADISDLKHLYRNMSETVVNLEETVEKHKMQTAPDVISNSVLQILLPYLNNMEDDLREKIEESASDIAKGLQAIINGSVTDLKLKACDNVSSLDEAVIQTISDLEKTLDEHNGQTSSRLDDLQDFLESTVHSMNHAPAELLEKTITLMDIVLKLDSFNASVMEEHDEIQNLLEKYKNSINFELEKMKSNQDTKLESLDSDLSVRVLALTSDLEHHLINNVTSELKKTHDLLRAHVFDRECASPLQHTYTCGGEAGWRRVVHLNMTVPYTECPSGWKLIESPKRMCARTSTSYLTCDSVFFPVAGGQYTKVCGRIIGYQHQATDAFEAYHDGLVTTIDGAYVSGISLTHGNPRQHIWTFASGKTEVQPTWNDVCPCDASIVINVPPFVGDNYFCESGDNLGWGGNFLDDPLWDGKNCTNSSACCLFKNPPYFIKQLSSPTSDEIEARICQWGYNEDTPIEFIELYVKGQNELIDTLESIQNELSIKMVSTAAELEQNILMNVMEEMHELSDNLHESLVHVCGSEGGWKRVVYLNMTDLDTNCPSGWQLTGHSKRSCGKSSSGGVVCDSVFFPVNAIRYNKVCGRIRGYQNDRTDAFETYHNREVTTIDGAYVSGVSLTHGPPGSRKHIWTFAAGASEVEPNTYDSCPCDATASINTPLFVDTDYFCESGVNSGSPRGFYPDDPLWDGAGCTMSSTCCAMNNPPYFTKQLFSTTTDDIEARLCRRASNDDTPVDFIELYVKEVIDPSQSPCGDQGWRRVVYLDMTDPNTNCPSGWKQTSHSRRSCGKVSSGSLTCDSVIFPVTGGEYSNVCGRIRAYQNSQTDAFETYHLGEVTTIDGAYVAGVSLTHGTPRQHIWSFAAGASETKPTWTDACPCDATITINVPPFVGGDYFCESGVVGLPSGFSPDDPLWDGQGCTSRSTCCSMNNPPYFTKPLPSPTSDDIEARICHWDPADDTPIEFIELYVR